MTPLRVSWAQAGLKAIDEFKAELADKGKNKANNRAGALRAMKALLDKFGQAAEATVVPMLGAVLEALADKMKPVCVEAADFNEALLKVLSPHAVLVRSSRHERTPRARVGGRPILSPPTTQNPHVCMGVVSSPPRRASCPRSSRSATASGSRTWAAR